MKAMCGPSDIWLRPRSGLRLQQAQGAHAPAQDFVAHGGEMQREEQKQKATAIMNSGVSKAGSMLGPPSRKTDAG